VNFDEHIARLVRDSVMPMLAERLDQLEERLVARLKECVQVQPALATAPPPLLTIVQVAKRLNVDKRTVERMVEAGDFPAPIRVGRAGIRWPQSDIDAWIEERKAR
jgi:prophage regulatory protein